MFDGHDEPPPIGYSDYIEQFGEMGKYNGGCQSQIQNHKSKIT
jgi:hypothetical protein